MGYFLGICTAIMTFLIYPLMMLGVMFSTKETLLMPEIKMRFGAIYNGKKIDTFGQRSFRLLFQLRRLFLLYLIFIMSD